MDPYYTHQPSIGPVAYMNGMLLFKYLSELWTFIASNFNFKTFALTVAQVLVIIAKFVYETFNLKAFVTSSCQFVLFFLNSVWIFFVTKLNFRSLVYSSLNLCYGLSSALWFYLQTQLDFKVLMNKCIGLYRSCVWLMWKLLTGIEDKEHERDDSSEEEEEDDEAEDDDSEEYEDALNSEERAMLDKMSAVQEAIRTRHATIIAAADMYRDDAIASLAAFHLQQQQERQQQLQQQGQQSESRLNFLRPSFSTGFLGVMSKLTPFANRKDVGVEHGNSVCQSPAESLTPSAPPRSPSSPSPSAMIPQPLHESVSTSMLDLLHRLSAKSGLGLNKMDLDLRKLSLLSFLLDNAKNDRQANSVAATGEDERKDSLEVRIRTSSSAEKRGQRKLPSANSRSNTATIQRPVLRFNATTSDIVDIVREYMGTVEVLGMVNSGKYCDTAEEMFRCGDEGSDIEISSLEILPNNTVRLTYGVCGLTEGTFVEVRDKLGQVLPSSQGPAASSLGKLWGTVTGKTSSASSSIPSTSWSFFTSTSTSKSASTSTSAATSTTIHRSSRVPDCPRSESSDERASLPRQTKRRSYTGERLWLRPDLESGGGSIVRGGGPDSGWRSSTLLLHLLEGRHKTMDADFKEKLFAVVEEAQPPTTCRRSVKLYGLPPSDETWSSAMLRTMSTRDWKRGLRAGQLLATYVPPTSDFQPSDVCFFPQRSDGCTGTVLLIADEVNDAIHVVAIVREENADPASSLLPSSSSSSFSPLYSSSAPPAVKLRFIRFLAAGSPLLVQPTALSMDSSAKRLWVACRGGAVLTIRPDL